MFFKKKKQKYEVGKAIIDFWLDDGTNFVKDVFGEVSHFGGRAYQYKAKDRAEGLIRRFKYDGFIQKFDRVIDANYEYIPWHRVVRVEVRIQPFELEA